jgi:hypothetical protein
MWEIEVVMILKNSNFDTQEANKHTLTVKIVLLTVLLGLALSCGGASSAPPPPPPNPVPSVSSLSPSSVVAGTAAFALTVGGTNFIPSSTVQWNGSNRSTTYVSATQLTASITAADIATPTYVAVTVVNPAPGGGTSASFSITPMWPEPAPGANGFLVDAPSQLASLSELNSFGGPLFAAWNPSPANAAGPGVKIMMFGTPDASCPPNTQGPMSSFPDAVFTSDGYPGQASAVPVDMRFIPTPMAACTPASAGKYGPLNVFSDGSQLWFYTASLGSPTDLLKPFSSAGQNANILNTSVNYQLSNLGSTVQPWARNGQARLAALVQVINIQAQDATALTQTKQEIGVFFINTPCIVSNPANLCQIYWQFAPVIAQSTIFDWTTASSFQHPNFFLDPVENNLPIVDVALIPVAGQTVNDAGSGLPLFTSRGQPTQHTSFGPMQFDIEIDFSQFENVIRIASALTLGQSVGTDAACAQCVQVFGTSWNDQTAWVLLGLSSQQEIYDASGTSGAILGSYAWFYGGAAP